VWDAGLEQYHRSIKAGDQFCNVGYLKPTPQGSVFGVVCHTYDFVEVIEWSMIDGGVRASKVVRLPSDHGDVLQARFSIAPSGNMIAIAGADEVLVHDIPSSKSVCRIAASNDTGEPTEVAFDGQGNLICGWSSGSVSLYDVTTGEPMRELDKHPSSVTAMCVSDDRAWVATGSAHGDVHVSGQAPAQEIQKLPSTGIAVTALSLSHDKTRLFIACANGQLASWSIPENKEAWKTTAEGQPITCMNVNRDGQLLATGGEDNQVRLWNANTGELNAEFVCSGGRITAIKFSHDGKYLISGTTDGRVMIWDVLHYSPQMNYDYNVFTNDQVSR
jgi:WD40 repeat protein